MYFKDEVLLGLAGDFVSKTESVREGNNTKSQSIMTVTVEAQKADAVLSYISQKWGLGAASHKNVARALLGQVLPSWEPCNAINPDVERIIVPRTSQLPTSTRNGLERAFDASSVSTNSTRGERQNVEPKQIAAPSTQHGSAEKNVAKLLHQAGLATSILKGEDFYLKVENKPYIPLSIERHGSELYLTHFLKDSSGDLFIDSEMVFNISPTGQLSLAETAVQNPLTGGELRRHDQEFGKIFSKNLISQGFNTAALSAFQAKEQSQPAESESIKPEQGSKPAAAPASTPTLRQTEPYRTSTTTSVHLDTAHLLELEPISSQTKLKSAATKTVRAKISSQSLRSKQLKEPIGVQLSLFDSGLNLASAQSQAIPQTPPRVKDVLPHTEVNKTAETTLDVLNTDQQAPASVQDQNLALDTAETLGDRSSTPMQIFQQVVDRVDHKTGEFLAASQSSSPSLDTLRNWYRAARELGKAQNYLNWISEVANEFKQGKPLEDKAFTVMQADLQAHHKQLITIEQVNQLSDRDFCQLHQAVVNHFKDAPPHPPGIAERQFVQNEVKQLQAQINQLWQKQAAQVSLVESMQKNPFRIWNGKYDAAVSQVQATTGLISQSLTQKDQKEQQLQQWEKLDEVHQAWSNSPQTSQM